MSSTQPCDHLDNYLIIEKGLGDERVSGLITIPVFVKTPSEPNNVSLYNELQ